MKLRLLLLAVLLVELVVLYDARFGLPDVLGPVYTRTHHATPPQPTVVLVVMDTVRADHTGLCGYDRPTTPYLSSLERAGASVACRAYAPGSWTMPSHASFFTGTSVPEHGVHFVRGTEEDRQVFDGTGFFTRPLGDALPTVAEGLAARGYQTVSVSANPLIDHPTGLARGFGEVVVENSPGWEVVRRVRSLLRGTVDPRRPLFLFVNLGDAHEPWEPVPSGLDWAPPRSGLGWGGPWSPYGLHDLLPWWYAPTDDFERLVTGRMPQAEKTAYLAHVTDVYDHGILLADRAVERLVRDLRAHGWADAGLRLVVTSDHGEHLGEHDLGDHGRFVTEPLVRVPLLVHHEGVEPPPTLPDPVSGRVVYDLTLDGALPEALPPLQAHAFRDALWTRQFGRGEQDRAAVWDDGQAKRAWASEDGTVAYDLGVDPLEAAPRPVPVPDPLAPALQDAVRAMQEADTEGGGMSDEIAEGLRQIGYVE